MIATRGRATPQRIFPTPTSDEQVSGLIVVTEVARRDVDETQVRSSTPSVPSATRSDANDFIDAQSDQSFPASDPPSWTGMSFSPEGKSSAHGGARGYAMDREDPGSRSRLTRRGDKDDPDATTDGAAVGEQPE
jgi:hypothetical protein